MSKETWEEKKQRKEEEKLQNKKAQSTKKIVNIVSVLVVILGIIMLFRWWGSSLPETDPKDIISRNGIHWHADLAISINGEQKEIPADLGIGARNDKIHTHDTTGELHVETSGLVKKEDIQLKKFFDIWGEQFNKSCILDVCAPDGETVQLIVNGEVNKAFENYAIGDGDKIEIRYPAKEIVTLETNNKTESELVEEVSIDSMDTTDSPHE